MKKILLISCAALCLILSACRPFTDRPRAVVTPTPVPEVTKQPATPTDLSTKPVSPTDISEPVSTPEGGNAALNENRQEIPFYYVFRGFYLTTPEKLSKIISGPDSSVLIQDEDGWHDYQDKYCPGIEWDAKFTFPDQYLFAEISMGAKGKFTDAYDVEKVFLSYDGLSVASNYNETAVSDRIHAYSDLGYGPEYGSAQYFVCIVAVNSADIPAGVAESMRYVY